MNNPLLDFVNECEEAIQELPKEVTKATKEDLVQMLADTAVLIESAKRIPVLIRQGYEIIEAELMRRAIMRVE